MVTMNIQMNKKLLYSIFASVLLFLGLSPVRIFAEEILVTGNGSASENTVQSTSTNQTTVTSDNNAEIQNNVDTTADTGNNDASNNTGNTTITTGDVDTSTSFSNQANTSIVDEGCCVSGGSSTTISGNGADSTNSATSTTNTSTTAIINQSATITNIISGTANTGYNTANNNTGNVSIRTGNINSYQSITNGLVNFSSVTLPSGASVSYSVKISGNGAGSLNNAEINNILDNVVIIENSAFFINDVTMVLNTGGNKALVNVGNVDIATGDIIARTEIKNVANVSKVKITCCEEKKENPPANPPAPTTNVTTSSSPSSSAGSSSAPQVQAAVIGKVLPATGGYWAVIFLLGNIIMLFMGAFVRLRSGRSPSVAFAC